MTSYETVKEFERRTGASTKVVTSVSRKRAGDRVLFRVATIREQVSDDGVVHRSPWLGMRELALRDELEALAIDFIAVETARLALPSMTFGD